MKKRYDVIVVGAGPIGSYTAYQLADKGFDVALIEARREVGIDVICAGVISKQAFKRYDLPSEAIVSRIDSFTFVSPAGQRLKYTHPNFFAYVVDRHIFDNFLLRLAKKFGAEIYSGTRINSITESNGYYKLETLNKNFSARSVIIATGIDYQLHKQIGLSKPPKFLFGSQIKLPINVPDSTIEIHIGSHFAPGSFGWVIPIANGSARVGLLVAKKSQTHLERMIKERLKRPFSPLNKNLLKTKPIAFGPVRRSVKGRILSVGEAAGQVKTTTGGGIFFGLLCSEIAVDKLSKTLRNNNNLVEYEETWRSVLIPELDIGMKVRAVANYLNDAIIENLFSFVKRNRFWVQMLLPRINFDFHSDLVFFCLKSFHTLLKIPIDVNKS